MTQELYKTVTSDWIAPTEFPDLSDREKIAIDLETCDPGLIKDGPGWHKTIGAVIGIAEAEPYTPAVTAVLASSVVILIVPLPRSVRVVVPDPVTFPDRLTSICGSGLFVALVKSK